MHLGNVIFSEEGNSEQAKVHLEDRLAYPSFLFEIGAEALSEKLTTRLMQVYYYHTFLTSLVALNLRQPTANGRYF